MITIEFTEEEIKFPREAITAAADEGYHNSSIHGERLDSIADSVWAKLEGK